MKSLNLISLVIVLVGVLIFTACTGPGPTPTEWEWEKTFGGTGTDTALSAQQTSDGGYIIAGITTSYGAGLRDFWLIKTDAEGEEEWSKTFGGTATDEAWSVQQTSDGGYIIAGITESYGAGAGDFWLVKTDGEGEEEWSKTFGGTDTDWAWSVQQTFDGGYVAAGITQSYGAGGGDFWLVKMDEGGEEEWNKTFGGTAADWAFSVQQTSDGGYIIAGMTQSYGAGLTDCWLVKTDSLGNETWNKTFGGSTYDTASSVQQTSDSGYIIAGTTQSYGGGGSDFWLIKTDGGGEEEWSKTFGGPMYDEAQSVQQTSDGGYIIAGTTQSYGGGGSDFWLIKTDDGGEEEWDKTFGGTDEDQALSVQQTSDGGYVIAGGTMSQGAGDFDVWIIKLE